MSKDTDSPFSPEAIAKASGRRLRDIVVKQLDRAQKGPRPSDFGDHEPIDEDAVIQVSMGKEPVPFKKLKAIDAEQWLDIADKIDTEEKE